MIAVLLLAALLSTSANSQHLALPSDLPIRDGVLGLRVRAVARGVLDRSLHFASMAYR